MARKLSNHEDVLAAIAEAIDIPEYLDQIARERYQSIGRWLDRELSTIKRFSPEISPQGSFLLGTVTRPVGDADEYDLDLVCSLQLGKHQLSMAELKNIVGGELIEYVRANRFNKEPEEGRRCWTIEYHDDARFHIDVLPALPDEQTYGVLMEKSGFTGLASNQAIREQAIAITDKTHPKYNVRCSEWPVSNPKGYAIWFRSRQAEIFEARKRAIFEAERIYLTVGDVPEYRVKTPLQGAIQLLKRHRDTMFGVDDDRPISIIITTLAAHSYNGENSIREALRTILRTMDQHIGDRNGVKWIANPVNPTENFADKWLESPAKEENFYTWLAKAQQEFGQYISASAYGQIPTDFRKALSETTVERILPMIAASPAPIVSSRDAGTAEVVKIQSEGGATKPWRQ